MRRRSATPDLCTGRRRHRVGHRRSSADAHRPPAILVAWSAEEGTWRATAIVSADLSPIAIKGPSSATAPTIGTAVDLLLTNRFGSLVDQDCPATMVSISEVAVQRG